CIHPDFLEDQITRSLARMHLDTLDVYLLHNPEYFLMSAIGEEGLPREEAERLFYDRIRRAFIHLEKLVEEGLIRYYGISSNGFPLHPDELDYVSLSKVWRAYQDACLQSGKTAEDGHFAVVQMPCNWVEHQAVTLPNNLWEGDMLSVVEMASRLRLGVLTNRPLNAIRDNRLLRFAAYSANPPANPRPHFDKHLENLETLEQTLRRYLTDHKIELDVRETPILDLFYNADRLRQLAEGGGDHSQAREILQSYFLPWIEVGSRTLADHMAEDTQLPVMLDAYQRLFLDTGQAWLDLIDAQNLVQISPFLEKLGQLSPTPAEEGSIAQKALQVCLNLPGVDVVLNGMRNSDYVAESMAVLNFPAGFDPLSLLTPSE
nr:aldo/keto reductase [Calditrichia bacterium]